MAKFNGYVWKESVWEQVRPAVLTLATVAILVGGAGYLSHNCSVEKKTLEEKNTFYEAEKAKLDSTYQVQLDSLERVYENKLEKISQE